MPDIVSIEQVREHVRLEREDASQDTYLQPLLIAARRAVERKIEKWVAGGAETITNADDLKVIGQAVLLLVGHWYMNRESVTVGQAPAEMPQAVEWLLAPYMAWTV